MVRPPLTDSVWPVMKPASSDGEERDRAGDLVRLADAPEGHARLQRLDELRVVGARPRARSGVLVGPGQTTFTWMP